MASGVGQLRARLAEHLVVLREAATNHEFLDLDSAERLHREVSRELDRWDQLPPHHRRALAQAVDYLVTVEDAEDDIGSPIGFDDDRDVVEGVLREIRTG